MAQRRMLSKKICDTDAFLEMPLSTQALYMHLVLNADDDGFVGNHKRIMRMIGCREDDMKMLIGKRFLIGFESGVIVIKHWKIHNLIRKERYTETTYTKEKGMLETKSNRSYKLIGLDSEFQDYVIPNDTQMSPQVSIGKVSLVEVKEHIVEVVDYNSYKDFFNSLENLPNIIKLTDKRKRHLKARLDDYSNDELKDLWTKANNNNFLTGNNSKGWKADFDWLINLNNLVKISEGKYDSSNIQKSFNHTISQAELEKRYGDDEF